MSAWKIKCKALRPVSLLAAVLAFPFAWAQEFEQRYPDLANGVDYQYGYWENLVTRVKEASPELDAPERAVNLIMRYYEVPEDLRGKLFARVILGFDQKYLVQIGVWGANDPAKFPREYAAKRRMAEKNCAAVSRQFDAYCETLTDITRSRPQVIVDLQRDRVIPLPTAVKATFVRPPTIGIDNFSNLEKTNIRLLDNLYIGLEQPAHPRFFKNLRLPFAGAPASRRCLSGDFAIADVDNDQDQELLFVGGKADDDLYVWQKVNKTYAYARIYLLAIDLSDGVAKPLFQDELFAYEMDYKGQSEGTGEGIVREARFYWGDFDRDGDADYLVRRQQADVSINWGLSEPTWQTAAPTEDAILYEGTAAGYEKSSAGGDAFLQYVGEHTDWNRGFPDPHNCQ